MIPPKPIAFLIAANLFATACFAGSPVISCVEPPNWWVNHSHNPIRLMLTGSNLSSATPITPEGLSLSNFVASADGSHAFCDLHIAADAKAGVREIKLKNAGGESVARFTVSPPLQKQDHFAGFSPDDVIYLIMSDRFANGDTTNDNPPISPGLHNRNKSRDYHGGDFKGVENHLSYLHDLGVTALWLTPWYDNVNHPNTKEKYTRDNQRSVSGIASTDYHGYGAVDFYSVEEQFGDMTSLRALVDAAHTAGFKFIQDQVANHTGPYHPWVENPPTPTWFNGSAASHLDNSWQTWTLAEQNPPQDKLKSTLEGWFINILPDLNQNDPETASYLIQNSLWWVGMTGLDAVRQDTLPYVPRTYWSQWTTALKREYPRLTILGEMWDAKPELVAFFQGGRKQFDGVDSGIETLFDFPLYFTMRDVFTKHQPMTRLAQTLAADSRYVDAGRLVTFLGSHDTSRFMSEPGATVEGLKLAFTYLLTTRGTPMIYYGDEIAMRGGGDPDNRRDFPGGWDSDDHNAFEQSGRTADEKLVHSHVKKLLALRREIEPLRRGEISQIASDQNTAVFARMTKDAAALVAFNNGEQARTIRLSLTAPVFARCTELFNRLEDSPPLPVLDGAVVLNLPAHSAMILTTQPSDIASRRDVKDDGAKPKSTGKNEIRTDARL